MMNPRRTTLIMGLGRNTDTGDTEMRDGGNKNIANNVEQIRFFDSRQKYLLFVNTCNEKAVVAKRVGLEIAQLQPRPPAMRIFDAGIGDGTVLSHVLRDLHCRYPTMPF